MMIMAVSSTMLLPDHSFSKERVWMSIKLEKYADPSELFWDLR